MCTKFILEVPPFTSSPSQKICLLWLLAILTVAIA